METNKIIEILKQKVESKNLNEFQIKLTEVLSFCESPIEELMILQIFDYLQNEEYNRSSSNAVDVYLPRQFSDVIFLENFISTTDIDYKSKTEMDYFIKKAKRNNYYFDEIYYHYEKYNRFKVNNIEVEGVTISEMEEGKELVCWEIEFIPQYDVLIDGLFKRIDIAIIVRRKECFSKKIIQEIKIALECDGYEFHKKKTTEDRIRDRDLIQAGWKHVLRYSGSEIYLIGLDRSKTRKNFQQMMDIIWSNVNK